jgi:hypothetical protein
VRQFRNAATLADVVEVPVVVVDEVVVDEVGGEADELEPQAATTSAHRIPSAATSRAMPSCRRDGRFVCAWFI